MAVLGIVAEFNPFHAGHRYLIETTKRLRRADTVVAVMSGSFTQRGELAVASKWERAEAAVRGGVDLVLELPELFAVSSAAQFARGGVEILEGMGVVDTLVFGSENGDLASLEHAACFLSEQEAAVETRLQPYLKKGLSYPAAKERAILELNPEFPAEVLRTPNNLLAVEYLRNLRTMDAMTIARNDAGYHASATEERRIIREANPAFYQAADERFFLCLKGILLRMKPEEVDFYQGTQGGLGRKLLTTIREVRSTEELIAHLKTKAYTQARISRMLVSILLGIRIDAVKEAGVYLRPLAMNEKGAALLRKAKKEERLSIPYLRKLPRDVRTNPVVAPVFETDRLAQNLADLFYGRDSYESDDFVKKPYIL